MILMRFLYSIPFLLCLSSCEQQDSLNRTQYEINELEKFPSAFIYLENKQVLPDNVCKTCEYEVRSFIHRRRLGSSKMTMKKYLMQLCRMYAGHWGPIACSGYVEIEIDTILFIIDNKQDLTEKRVCAILFQDQGCLDPNAEPWSIPLPEISQKKRPRELKSEASSDTISILHLTDIHYDPLYKPGSDSNCKVPLCCQYGVPNNTHNAAGYWGDYNVCDMPWHSLKNLMDRVRNAHTNLNYIYFTGDIVSHDSWNTTVSGNTQSIKRIYELFAKTFKTTPIFPILGNHESHPTNHFSPEKLSTSTVSTQWIFDLVAEEWGRWLPHQTKPTIKKGGYYTVLVKPGFRIIALNSNVCFTSNLWLLYEDKDPYEQLTWLVNVLAEAEKNGENVHMLSHIPPGETTCHKQWSQQFRRIVNRFANTIVAQFNGHTHMDEWRLFYDDQRKPVNVAFNGGSFATFVGFNSNYRVYQTESSNMIVQDYDQYIFNLTKANKDPKPSPDWYRLYSFKEAYGLTDLNLESLGKLVQEMSKNASLLQKYFKFSVKNDDADIKEGCDKSCLKKLLCSITAVEANQALHC